MPSERDFPAVAEYLFSLKARGPKFGIDRMRALATALGHPERRTPCIHVAGTNGKGSVAAMLDAVLRAAGWRTGLYTSPHLVHVGERVQVNRRPLTEAEIVAYVRELDPVGAQIATDAPDLRPSFFEFMTAMAFLQFAREACDIAVLEVGLGGRLDATNIVQPEVCVITSIGLDHCELLGNEIGQIAAEKAGIIKAGVPVVVGRMPREAEKVIRATAAQIGAPLVSVAERFGETPARLPVTNLAGEYQRWNAATATLAAQSLHARWRISPDVVARGLNAVDWPGRWQRVRIGTRTVVLDASHNPEGAETLDGNLAALAKQTGRPPLVVTGVLGTTRAEPLIHAICRHARAIHLVVPGDPRACSYEELASLIPPTYEGAVVRDTVDHIFPAPETCALGDPDDTVVVTGSIYLLGEVMARLSLESGNGP
jgi:dihydrofolate synthase/folylpolyglutamate synthase